MKILLDTEVWLWMISEPARLSPKTRKLLVAIETELYLSAASAWEIAIKHGLGKLELPEEPLPYVERLMAELSVLSLPILHRHALSVGSLPEVHRDPFDRILVAQALVENLQIVTADSVFRKYDVRVLSP